MTESAVLEAPPAQVVTEESKVVSTAPDAWAELKAIEKAEQKPPPPKPQPKKEEPKAEARKDEKPAEIKPVEKVELKQEAKAEPDRLEFKTNKGMRDHISKLEGELKELKSKPAPPPDARFETERKALVEELAGEKKRREELESDLRNTAYEKSSEFKDRFIKPWDKKVEIIGAELKELTVTDDVGNERPASWQDFNMLLGLPLRTAAAKAQDMFGPAANHVMQRRTELAELQRTHAEALETSRNELGAREQKSTAERVQQHTALMESWKSLGQQALIEHKELFGPEEGDEEGNKQLEKGMAFADAAYNTDKNWSMEDSVKIHTLIKFRAGAFDREHYRANTYKAKNDELEKRIGELEGTLPGKDDGAAAPKEKSGAPTKDEWASLDN